MDAQCWQADTLITAVMNDTVSNGIIIPTQAYSYTHTCTQYTKQMVMLRSQRYYYTTVLCVVYMLGLGE